VTPLNFHPFNQNFIFGKSPKSQGATSGEQKECGNTTVFLVKKMPHTHKAMWDGTLSYANTSPPVRVLSPDILPQMSYDQYAELVIYSPWGANSFWIITSLSKKIINTLLKFDFSHLALFRMWRWRTLLLGWLGQLVSSAFISCYDLKNKVSVISDLIPQVLAHGQSAQFLAVIQQTGHKHRSNLSHV
jgi:hypothetical protein